MGGKLWSIEEEQELYEYWHKGMQVKLLAERFPRRTPFAVANKAKAMSLPKRRIKSKYNGRRHKVTLYLTEGEKDFIGRRAFARGQAQGDYMRMLIRRDMGE